MNLRNLPLQRKLTLLMLAASALSLFLASVGFALYERSRFRQASREELTALAETLGSQYRGFAGLQRPKDGKGYARCASRRAAHSGGMSV